jgi:hypothetical protein
MRRDGDFVWQDWLRRDQEKPVFHPLVHIAEKRAGEPALTLIDYDEANLQESGFKTAEECFSF